MKRLIKWMLFSVVVIASSKSNAQSISNVLDNYLVLKDALVESDAEMASSKANTLMITISKIDVKALTKEEANMLGAFQKDIMKYITKISKSKEIDEQRTAFSNLSELMYKLVKSTNTSTVLYYQRCPMYQNGKGANWLSKDSNIKNPYFGSRMMNCGKTIETLK